MNQTSHHRDTEALRTEKKGPFLCASVSLWLMQSIFSHLHWPGVSAETAECTRKGLAMQNRAVITTEVGRPFRAGGLKLMGPLTQAVGLG
jgi:hypothetical protein